MPMRGCWGRGLALLVSLSLPACQRFAPPTPPQPPLTKAQVSALAKCQTAIKKAQAAFVKVKLGSLDACVDTALNLQLAVENDLVDQQDYIAGLDKTKTKCTKGFGKITAASTKMIDAIVKSCTPVESLVFGPYDGLRFQTQLAGLPSGPPPTTIVGLAGVLCTLTEQYADAQVWQAVPRMMEVLAGLGPEFVHVLDQQSGTGFPNVPLDPRCIPFVAPAPNPTATPP
jgi:hypothetical protein